MFERLVKAVRRPAGQSDPSCYRAASVTTKPGLTAVAAAVSDLPGFGGKLFFPRICVIMATGLIRVNYRGFETVMKCYLRNGTGRDWHVTLAEKMGVRCTLLAVEFKDA